MVTADVKQPTTAEETTDAPATEPTGVSFATDADSTTQQAAPESTTASPQEQVPEWKTRLDALEKQVADKDARLRGQDKAINKLVRRLEDIKAGTPEAKALRLELEAMRADAANQVDPSDPNSATAKAKEAGKALLHQEAAREEADDLMGWITDKLSEVGELPVDGVIKVTDENRHIARAVRNGERALAEYLTEQYVKEKKNAMTTQTAKPATKTYTEADFQKAVAEQVAKLSQKANKGNLRESGLLETSSTGATGGGTRYTRQGAEDAVAQAVASGDLKKAREVRNAALDQFYKRKT